MGGAADAADAAHTRTAQRPTRPHKLKLSEPAGEEMFVRWLGVLAVLGGAAAMYVDEQGSRDWMREHLGQVTRASFRKREMFGATVSGAVFKLQNARTGKVQWRHVLPGQEAACTLLLNKQTLFTMSAAGGGHAYMWQATDGSLLWDRHIGGGGEDGDALSRDDDGKRSNGAARPELTSTPCDGRYGPVDLDDDGIDDIVVLLGNSVSLLSSGERGEPFWTFVPEDSGVRLVAMHVSDDGEHIYAVGVADDRQSVLAYRLSSATGEQTGAFSTPGAPTPAGGAFGSGVVLSENESGGSYAVYVVEDQAGAKLRVVALEVANSDAAAKFDEAIFHDTALSEVLPPSMYDGHGVGRVAVSPVTLDQSRPGLAPFVALEISPSSMSSFPSESARHAAAIVAPGGGISVVETYSEQRARTMAFGVGVGRDGTKGKTTAGAKFAGATAELAFAVVVETGGAAGNGHSPGSTVSVQTVPGVVRGVEKGCSASVPVSEAHGALIGAFVHAIAKRDGSAMCRVMTVSQDWHLGMLSHGSRAFAWEKAYEAIADIVQVEMIDYNEEGDKLSPAPDRSTTMASEVSYADRLSGQLDLVGGMPGRVVSLLSMVQDFFHDRMNKNQKRRRQKLTAAQRSTFGFSKLIIGVARSGKIIALYAETGDVAWTRFFPGLAKSSRGRGDDSGSRQRKVFVIRDKKSPGGLDPELLVLHQGGGKGEAPTTWKATWVDGQSGRDLRHADLPCDSVEHTMLLPRSAALDTRILVAVDANLGVHVVPDTSEAREEVAGMHRSLFIRHFSSSAAGENTVQGLGLADARHAVPRWSLVLPAGSRLVDWASVSGKEAVASPAHQQGNDGLLIKYLNPHLIAVAALNDDTRGLIVYLVDSVTGHIIRQYKHKDAAEPVHLVRSENWAFCTYWNEAGRRTEISSIALFEGEVDPDELNPWSATPPTLQPDTDDDDDVLGARAATAAAIYGGQQGASATDADSESSGAGSGARPMAKARFFSSFSASDPVALQKTFVFPTGIKAVEPTLSKRGITNKHLLVGLVSDQILLLNRLMLDPRRPTEAPTDADKKEGLFMYTPIVHYPNAAIITYTKRIPRLSLIRSYPAELESTSLVIGLGIDMFYARTNPSKGFDLMPDDFSYAQLLLICGGLSFGVWWARSALQKKKLAKMWA